MNFNLGDNFRAKYNLERQIGRTTNSRVYQISRFNDGKEDFVVKILNPKSKQSSDKLSRRFEREMEE